MKGEIEKIENQFLSDVLTSTQFMNQLGKIQETSGFQHRTIGVLDGSMLLMRLDLKQLSLFFDQFYVIDAEKWLQTTSFSRIEKTYLHNRAEFEWLKEKEVIKTVQFESSPKQNLETFRSEIEKLNQLFEGELYQQVVKHQKNRGETYQQHLAELLYRMGTYKSRIQSAYLRQSLGNEAYPIIDNLNDMGEFLSDLPKAHVVNVLLKKIPVPDVQTPWEQLLEFRSNDDAREKYLRVKRWLYKTATQEVNTLEMYQEIDSLIHEYEQYMALHKLKFQQGMLKASVLTTVDFVENMMKLNFSKAAKALFNIQQDKVKMLEAEMKAPGRELSYFVKLRQTF